MAIVTVVTVMLWQEPILRIKCWVITITGTKQGIMVLIPLTRSVLARQIVGITIASMSLATQTVIQVMAQQPICIAMVVALV